MAAKLRIMELRHLRYFVAVAEEMSFTRAAERLHMRQPPLSIQIRHLERELGAELFDRSGRGITLTLAGRTLFDEARRIIDEIDGAARTIRRIADGELGHLTIAFIPSAANCVLGPVLRAFRNRYANVELRLHEMSPDDALEAVRERRADLAFLYRPLVDENLNQRVVADEPLLAAVPADHPLANAAEIDLRDLGEESFILPRQYGVPGLNAQVLAACSSAGFRPHVIQKDIWLTQTILSLVAAGLGVALVPRSAARLQRAGIAYLPLSHTAHTIPLGAVWRRDSRSPALSRFLELLADGGWQDASEPPRAPGDAA
jgi:DNA-binding transcriptional LysR family regulator